ncbi:MAG: SMC family ATPase [Caldisphaeraceae archaeon]|nr:SMC family ATPase [Caldisphaeraceae archaeon]
MGYFIIDSLVIKDFISHSYTKMDFSSGSMAILGENGAGKSSILEAIFYAFTLKPWRERSYIVKAGSHRSVINIILREAYGNTKLELNVTLSKRGNSIINDVLLKRNGKIEATKVEDYKRLLWQYLNIGTLPKIEEFLQGSVIVKQNILSNIASRMSDSRKDFKELIESALGINIYKEAQKGLKSIDIKPSTTLGGQVFSIRQKHRDILKQGVEDRRSDVNNIIKTINETKDMIKKKLEEKRVIEENLKNLKEEEKELQSKLFALGSMRLKKEEIERQKEKLSNEIEEIERQKEKLSNEIEEIERQKDIAGLYSDIIKYEEVLRKIYKLEAEIAELREMKRNYEILLSTKADEEKYNELLQNKQEIENKISTLRLRKAEFQGLYDRFKKVKVRLGKLYNGYRDVLADYKEDLEAFRIDGLLNKIKAELDATKRDYESCTNRKNEMIDRISLKKSTIQNIKKYLEVLKKPGKESECPVCHSKLSGKTVEDLKKGYEQEVKRQEAELNLIREDYNRVDKSIKEYERKISRLETVVANLEVIAGEISNEMKESEFGLRKIEEEIKDEEKRLEDVSSKMKALEDAHKKYEFAAFYFRETPIDYIENRIKDYKRKVDEYNKYKALADKITNKVLLVTNSNDMSKAKEKVINSRSKLSSLNLYKENLKKYERELEEKEKELEEKEKELEEISLNMASMEGVEERYKDLSARIKEMEEAKDSLLMEISSLKGEVKAKEERLEKLKVEIGELERLIKKIDMGLASINIFEKVQKILYSNALIALENEMNNIFSRFGLDYSRIEIRENDEGNLGVYVIDRSGNERPVSVLSGGEQTVIALTFIIALNKIIQAKIGFLALDEPTESLDEQRRKVLVDVLGRLTESYDNSPPPINQLILVTHHADIIDAIDQVCNISKKDGVSKVQCQGD